MKPEEQRIAIAEACGWKHHWIIGGDKPDETKTEDSLVWFAPGGGWVEQSGLPDYLKDLNAMHEAERWLKTNHIKLWVSDYWQAILSVCECDKGDGMLNAVHATAAQRCEALLRAKGLWKERYETNK